MLRQKLDVSEKAWKALCALSLVWVITWLLVLLPPVRNLIIAFGEMLVHRPLTHAFWHERFIAWGIGGLLSPLLLLCFGVSESLFLSGKADKAFYRFLVPVIAASGVFLILFHANWTFGDDHLFTTCTEIDRYLPIHVFKTIGRFNPAQDLDKNLILFMFRLFGLHTGVPPQATFISNGLFYLITILCLYKLCKKIEMAQRANSLLFAVFFTCFFLFLSQSFISIYMQIIFPETALIMFLTVFMLALFYAQETNKTRYYILAFVFAVYATYCKEPVFGALVILALTNLICNFKGQTKKEKLFYFLLIVNGIVFCFLYYIIVYRNISVPYNSGRDEGSRLQIIISNFMNRPILTIMLVLGFFRFYYVILRKDRSHIFYDSLLFAGIGYTCAFILLRLSADYYFIPSIILALPSLVYWSVFLYQKKHCYSLVLLIPLCIVICFNFVPVIKSAKHTLHARENFMPYIDKLHDAYTSGEKFIWYEDETPAGFAIVARDYYKAILNIFLNNANKTDGINFFDVVHEMPENLPGDILFFYPPQNNHSKPMSKDIADILANNDFVLDSDEYGSSIYSRRR
jgi:hypothetical protein